jgi:hypothetical protein
VDALLFELSMIRCTKELKEEAIRAAERRKLHGEKYLTTLYKEFREGIPEKEAYRIVLAEVRDTFLVTKVSSSPPDQPSHFLIGPCLTQVNTNGRLMVYI